MRFMLKKLCVGIVLCLTLVTAPSCFHRPNIHEVQTLELLEREVSTLDENCLVVFDVDWTLLIDADPIFHPKAKAVRKRIKEITKVFNREQWEDFYSRLNLQTNRKLVSKKTPDLIKKLLQKGVKVIALTATFSGRFGVIESVEDKRLQELKNVGIDFSSAFPDIQKIEFKAFEKMEQRAFPLFKQGVLFGRPKGKLLGAFLDKTGFKPKRIIFVDDRIKHVNAVARMCKEKGITFLGLHYTQAYSLRYEVDEATAKFQVNTFAATGKWLSAEQAKKRMRDNVKDCYAQWGGEEERLYKRARGIVERFRTESMFRRYLPKVPAVVYDVGGGAGVYAFPLTEQGYSVHLIDFTPLHIEQAKARMEKTGLKLASALVGDARDLRVPDSVADAVLLLGPLYHLPKKEDRAKTLQEAYRILKTGGVLFAAGCTRFGPVLRYAIRKELDQPEIEAIAEEGLKTGCYNLSLPGRGVFSMYTHRSEELEQEVADAGFTGIKLFAVEGPTWMFENLQEIVDNKKLLEKLLYFLEKMENEQELIGASGHLMAIGRK